MKSIGVIGAGIMGSGIAQVCAQTGLDVALFDTREAAAHSAVASIDNRMHQLVVKGAIDSSTATATVNRVQVATNIVDLGGCDIVIEAATEHFETKRQILNDIENATPADLTIATNTSSISITKLGSALRAPERLVGMHFFNPVPLMGLVEVIPGLRSSPTSLARARELIAQLGKTAIDVKNSPGFVVNRILVPMLNEAITVLQEGLASAADIDAGMKLGANHPIGPLALADMVGLDTLLAAMDTLYRDFSDPKYRAAPLLREMVDAGLLGRKSSKGFYSYG
ncbi:3-hydroxyacyl-CoA dehydrogenase NAD-binding domain-containing protein [Paraburkholderia phytofirmans]|uniref:3-hydroxyacyl-CoA dehydrogenase NAD-binding domain-containing protein n=1 Tax=Paraburkholderia phytofirmans TaxID=261302 RepID=UPI0038BB482B